MFKPGEKVICIRKQFSNETIGKIYIVKRFFSGELLDLQIIKDDNGNVNSYKSSNFKLVKSLGDLYLPPWF